LYSIFKFITHLSTRYKLKHQKNAILNFSAKVSIYKEHQISPFQGIVRLQIPFYICNMILFDLGDIHQKNN